MPSIGYNREMFYGNKTATPVNLPCSNIAFL